MNGEIFLVIHLSPLVFSGFCFKFHLLSFHSNARLEGKLLFALSDAVAVTKLKSTSLWSELLRSKINSMALAAQILSWNDTEKIMHKDNAQICEAFLIFNS